MPSKVNDFLSVSTFPISCLVRAAFCWTKAKASETWLSSRTWACSSTSFAAAIRSALQSPGTQVALEAHSNSLTTEAENIAERQAFWKIPALVKLLSSREEHVHITLVHPTKGLGPIRRGHVSNLLVYLADKTSRHARKRHRVLVASHLAKLLTRTSSTDLGKDNAVRHLGVFEEADLLLHLVRGCDLVRAFFVLAVGMRRRFLVSLCQSLLLLCL
jgi:hypothetical protein